MLIVFTLGWIGCARVARVPVGDSVPVALDELLLKPEVRARIREAERDLPEDVWKAGGESQPVIRNVSRSEREAELAYELLQPVHLQIKKLSAAALVDSLKTEGVMTAIPTSGVADQFYMAANLALIKELGSRRRWELESLRSRQNDSRIVYTGNDGGLLTVGGLIRSALVNPPP